MHPSHTPSLPSGSPTWTRPYQKASDELMIASIKRETGLEVIARPEAELSLNQIREFQLVTSPLGKPKQVDRKFMRWFVPNMGYNVAVCLVQDRQKIICFGHSRNEQNAVGGQVLPPVQDEFRLDVTAALGVIGNVFFTEGHHQVIYPLIMLPT